MSEFTDSVFDENSFYGKHALMMVNGFATNAYTGQAAFIPDHDVWHSPLDHPIHAASSPADDPTGPVLFTPLTLSPLDTLDGFLRDGQQN